MTLRPIAMLASIALSVALLAAEPPSTGRAAPAKDQTASSQTALATPPMGWNSWFVFRGAINETIIRQTADAMVNSGMRDAGYTEVDLDHMWQLQSRDAAGDLQADPAKFPHGIKAVADYVHSKGLKLGIYARCLNDNYPGSFGYEQQDANLFASWGVDHVKLDFCNEPARDLAPDFDRFQVIKDGTTIQQREAEDPANSISGGANIVSCSGCSGAKSVASVGNGDAELDLPDINVPTAGTYHLQIDYANSTIKRTQDPRITPSRRARIRVNGGPAHWVDFNPTGSAAVTDTTGVDLQLRAGTNTIMIDNPTTAQQNTIQLYTRMRDALQRTGRKFVLEVCEWGSTRPWQWAPQLKSSNVSIIYRSTPDIANAWNSVTTRLDEQVGLTADTGPGAWNFPDMVRVGGGATFPADDPGGMKSREYQAQFGLWSILNAPLQAATDLRTMSDETKAVLTNKEVIAVDQDWSGQAGQKIADDGDHEVWAKPMSDGSAAVALLNRGEKSAEMSITAADLGLPAATAYRVRNLWQHRNTETHGTVATLVDGHSAALYRVSADNRAPADAPPMVSVSTDAPDYLPSGRPTVVAVTIHNLGEQQARDVEPSAVATADDWTIEPVAPPTTFTLAPGASRTVHYKITGKSNADGNASPISLKINHRWQNAIISDGWPLRATVPPDPPSGETYLSDLTWTHMHAGIGAKVANDKRIGGAQPLIVNGTTYAKGLGTYAWSDLRYNLGGKCTAFHATAGLDDATHDGGTVTFQVWGDGHKLFDSGLMTGADPGRPVAADVTGVTQLQLVVTNGGDPKYQWNALFRFQDQPEFQPYRDFSDWIDARVNCS